MFMVLQAYVAAYLLRSQVSVRRYIITRLLRYFLLRLSCIIRRFETNDALSGSFCE